MTTERLEPQVKTAINRIAYDMARPTATAIAIRLQARAQQLTDEGIEPVKIIEIITQEVAEHATLKR
ncbi:MAG: hypothetical protein J7605_14405 [Variovorax sp.]|nr:hypothetical protein [Variovorax sp.]